MADTQNVIVPGEITTGYGFVGVSGAALPTDPTKDITEAVGKSFGRIGEDGITRSFSSDSEEIKDMFGNTVATVKTSDSETFGFSMLDVNETSLAIFYGAKNVTGSKETGFTIKSNGKWTSERSYILRFIVGEDETAETVTYGLIVIPKGKLTERGDQTITGSDAIGHEITITALPDASGHRAYLYTSAPVSTKATGTTGE